MKLIKYFDEFLKQTVNLNQTRIDTLNSRVDTITGFIKNSVTFKEYFKETKKQGSWAHKTIIKPSSKKDEFDADVLLFMDKVDDWEAKDYISNLYSVFRSSELYKNKVSRGSRCVTLDYADEFHIDIVPIFDDGIFLPKYMIANRNDNVFEETNPDGYTEWFLDKNKFTEKNHLVKVVRLVKYLRDIKGNFSVKSILLTTLLGQQVNDDTNFGDDKDEDYPDLPTSLKTIFNRFDAFLQENPTMPEISNPSLESETFTRHWDQDIYSNFRDKINLYAGKINDAFDETDRAESAKKWQNVFGEGFAYELTKEVAKSTDESKSSLPSHCEQPPWPIYLTDKVRIDAYIYFDKNRQKKLGGINSNGRYLDKNLYFRFYARTNIDDPFNVFWQVVNTGAEAALNQDLRGEIFPGDIIRDENTLYTGRHWIECFIVKNGICVAKSGRFFVNIK